MRHRVAGSKLGRNSAQRSSLRRNLVTDLFRYEAIRTTRAKAEATERVAEHLITIAKRGLADGGNPVHARRQAARVITDPEVTKRLFNELAPRFVDRPGGYVRLRKLGFRLGDGAEMALVELVDRPAKK